MTLPKRSNETRLQHVETQLEGLTKTVQVLVDKFDEISRIVISQGARPQYEIGKILIVVATAVGIFGATASGIIFISSAVNSSAILENKLRNEFLRERLDRGWLSVPGNRVTVRAKNDLR